MAIKNIYIFTQKPFLKTFHSLILYPLTPKAIWFSNVSVCVIDCKSNLSALCPFLSHFRRYLESQGSSRFLVSVQRDRGYNRESVKFFSVRRGGSRRASWKVTEAGSKTATCKGTCFKGSEQDAGFGCQKGPRELWTLLSNLLGSLLVKLIGWPFLSPTSLIHSQMVINRSIRVFKNKSRQARTHPH